MVSVTFTATDIPGADLSEPFSFGIAIWNVLEQTCDCDLSWLSSIPNSLSHLALLPGSVEGGSTQILAWVAATTHYRFAQHTVSFSFIIQSILTLCTMSLAPGLLLITMVT